MGGPAGDGFLGGESADADRILIWQGLDSWRSEVVNLRLGPRGLLARGSQAGVDPVPYRLEYELDAPDDFVTERMSVEAQGAGWRRRLELCRGSTGEWSARTEVEGEHPSLPEPGGDTASLAGAFDCDLGFSPLTNLMPIRRSGLDREPGTEDFLMAWISVPSLEVIASGQRYEHVGADERGAVVRYVDQGLFPGYEANLQLDRLGLVVHYPGLGKRVEADSTRGRRSAPGWPRSHEP